MNEIHNSQRFYKWLNSILDKRYNPRACSVVDCVEDENNPRYQEKADELINFILNISLPEIDMDQYKITFGISASEFALKKADEFKRSFFSNTQSGSNTHSNPDQGGNLGANQRNLSTSGDDVLS